MIQQYLCISWCASLPHLTKANPTTHVFQKSGDFLWDRLVDIKIIPLKTTIIIFWKLLGHLHCPPSSRHSTGSRSLLQWGPGILCPAILIGFPKFFPGGGYNQKQARERQRESSKHATWKRPSRKDTTNLKVALWVLDCFRVCSS